MRFPPRAPTKRRRCEVDPHRDSETGRLRRHRSGRAARRSIWGNPEAAVIGLPFIVAVLAGLALVERPHLEASIDVDRERLLEGDDVHLAVTLRSTADVPWLQIAWQVPQNLAAAVGGYVIGVRLVADEPATLVTAPDCEALGRRAAAEAAPSGSRWAGLLPPRRRHRFPARPCASTRARRLSDESSLPPRPRCSAATSCPGLEATASSSPTFGPTWPETGRGASTGA